MGIRVDQLVFGYDDGHRLLGGSIQVTGEELSTLLGATDATTTSNTDRLITGIQLVTSERYALCFTWPAPEAARPGAVWSHALLIDFPDLGRIADPAELAGLAERPRGDLAKYKLPLTLQPHDKADGTTVEPVILAEVLSTIYGDNEPRIIVSNDLVAAERILFAVWRAQWPDLRTSFQFRTREQVRPSSVGQSVVATRRIVGMTLPADRDSFGPAVSVLVESVLNPTSSEFVRFLGRYGPEDNPELSTVGALAKVFYSLRSGNVDGARVSIESRYPLPSKGFQLKVDLFGESDQWWHVPDAERVESIFRSETDAWDPFDLRLADRIDAWVGQASLSTVLAVLPEPANEGAMSAEISVLRRYAKLGDFAIIAQHRPRVAAQWLALDPALGRNPATWRGLDRRLATDLIRYISSPDDTVLDAALVGGQSGPVIEVVGLSRALTVATQSVRVESMRAVVAEVPWPTLLAATDKEPRIVVALAGASGRADVPTLLSALEGTRGRLNEYWLRAAVAAIAFEQADLTEVLQVVFGPLHHAITDDRLPRDCWSVLGAVLPEAHDPALRLRRLLIRVSRDRDWTPEMFRRALRDAGPYADELLRDLESDEPVTGLLRSILNLVGLRW
jgi:GTPase-associated protein 1, N-terminal domain type 1